VLLALLSLAVFLAAALVAARAYAGDEAIGERALAACLLTVAQIEAVLYGLGWSNTLTRTNVIALSLVLAALVSGIAIGTEKKGARIALLKNVRTLFTQPYRHMRELQRHGSPAWLGGIWLFGLAAWTLIVAWLAPTGAWDGLWYHEPMVGFAIQSHGFGIVPVQPGLEMVNGYARGTENLMLWASILYDRRLIDSVPSFAFLMAALATYVLARRHNTTRSAATSIAVIAVTIPGAALQLRSTYVDLAMMAATLTALHFSSRPQLRIRDAWFAWIAIGLLATIKVNGIVFGTILAGWLVLRSMLQRDWRFVLHTPLGILVALAYGAPTYARNWLLHQNPLWPITYQSELFGFSLVGTIDAGHMQRDFAYVWGELTGPPFIGESYHDTGRHAYGYGVPFIAAPLSLIALWSLVNAWWSNLHNAKTRSALLALGFAFGFGLLIQVASPGHHWSRFSLSFPAVALVLIAWWTRSGNRIRIEEGAFTAMLFANALTLLWATPGWDVTVMEAWELAQQPLVERNLADTSHCLLAADTRRRRDEVLQAGTVAAFADDVGFPGNLWNDDFSNRVIAAPYTSDEDFIALLDREHVAWVYVGGGSAESSSLRRNGHWHVLIPATFTDEIWERNAEPDVAPAAVPDATPAAVLPAIEIPSAAPLALPPEQAQVAPR
jgi:hypothetical protein